MATGVGVAALVVTKAYINRSQDELKTILLDRVENGEMDGLSYYKLIASYQ